MDLRQNILILDELMCQDTSGIVLDFLYEKCYLCKKHIEQRLVSLYNEKFLCMKCFFNNDTNICVKCKKIYLININSICLLCGCNPCRLFCPNCLKDKYVIE